MEVQAPKIASSKSWVVGPVSAPPAAKGSSAVKGCRPARISCANPAALPRTTTSFMSAIVSTPVGKRIFTKDFLLRMRMYLYPPILGSPHFWQTDKARFLQEQRKCWNSYVRNSHSIPRLLHWSALHQRP